MGGAGQERVAGLLDRDRELAALADVVVGVRAGRGSLTLVTGVPGSGRSRLLHEAAGLARRAGCEVRHARGGALDGRTPALLVRRDTPLVLVVDDIQLAGPAARAAVAGAASRAALAVVAAAPSGHDDALGAAAEVVRLRPLGLRATTALVRATLGPGATPAFCRACHAHSGGRPRELVTLLDAARLDAVTPDDAGLRELERLATTRAVHELAAALRSCSTPAGDLATAIAVVGPQRGIRTAARLVGLTRDAAAHAERELVAAGVLRRAASTAFAAPATAHALALTVPPERWSGLHAEAARLARTPSAAARHLLHVLPDASPATVAALRTAAARAAGDGDAAHAAELLRRALAEPPLPGDEPRVLFELARAEAACGSPAAPTRMQRALDAETDPERAAEVALALGRLLAARGAYRRARQVITGAAERLAATDAPRAEPTTDPAPDGREVAPSVADLHAAIVAFDRAEHGPGEDVAARAAAILAQPTDQDRAADRVTLVEAAHEAMVRNGTCAELLLLARRAWADGRLLDEQTGESTAIAALCAVLCWADALDEDVDVLTAAYEQARRSGSVLAEATASGGRAWPRWHRGELVAAWDDAQRARAGEAHGWAMFVATSRAIAAHVAIERGDLDAAEEALSLPSDAQWPAARLTGPYFGPYFEARARLHLARGRAARAEEDARSAGQVLAAVGADTPSALVPWRSTAALACAALARADEAEVLAREEVALAEQTGNPRLLGIGLRTLGTVLGGGDGLTALEASVAALERSQATLELARSRAAFGAALRRAGHRTASREPLSAALAFAERVGATTIAAAAAGELAAAAPARRTGGSGLTASELRVATMAAQGLGNRAIATALQVTPQTVNWHLGNCYRKLGVRRDGLAAVLAHHDEGAP